MTAKPNATPSAEETAARVLMRNWRHNEGSDLLRMSGEDIQTLNRAIASALSDTRRKALEEAARMFCGYCDGHWSGIFESRSVHPEGETWEGEPMYVHQAIPPREGYARCLAAAIWRKTEGESNG